MAAEAVGDDAVFLVGVDDDEVGDRAAVEVADEAVALVERRLGDDLKADTPKCTSITPSRFSAKLAQKSQQIPTGTDRAC